ncbi:hypothetical protein PYCC9005_000522 [Savitreella phatthalungensis]
MRRSAPLAQVREDAHDLLRKSKRAMERLGGLLETLGLSPRASSRDSPGDTPQSKALFKTRDLWLAIQRHSKIDDASKREAKLIHDLAQLKRLFEDDEALDEASRSSRVCLEYALQRDAFTWLTQLALDGPTAITASFMTLMVSLVEKQDDDFLAQEDVCRNLQRLFQYLYTRRRHQSHLLLDTAELLTRICQKTMKLPPLISIWFDRDIWRLRVPLGQEHLFDRTFVVRQTVADDRALRDEFLLFQLLLAHVSERDAIGRLSRDCIFMLVAAARDEPEALLWIGVSDLPKVIATTLGACWSNMALSSRTSATDKEDVEAADAAFRQLIDHLQWLQDLIKATSNIRFKLAFIVAYREHFLAAILYPSVLSTSAIDDAGSIEPGVLAIMQIDALCRCLREPELIDATLAYLFGIANTVSALSNAPAEGPDPGLSTTTPSLFSMLDILHDNLRPESPQELQAASLRLCDTLLGRMGLHVEEILLHVRTIDMRRPAAGWLEGFDGTDADFAALADLRSGASASGPVVATTAPGDSERMTSAAADLEHDLLPLVDSQPTPLALLLPTDTKVLWNPVATLGSELEYASVMHGSGRVLHPQRLYTISTQPGSGPWLLECCFQVIERWTSNDLTDAVLLSATGVILNVLSCRRISLAGWFSGEPLEQCLLYRGKAGDENSVLQEIDDECTAVEAELGLVSDMIKMDDATEFKGLLAMKGSGEVTASGLMSSLKVAAVALANHDVPGRRLELYKGFIDELTTVIRLRRKLTGAALTATERPPRRPSVQLLPTAGSGSATPLRPVSPAFMRRTASNLGTSPGAHPPELMSSEPTSLPQRPKTPMRIQFGTKGRVPSAPSTSVPRSPVLPSAITAASHHIGRSASPGIGARPTSQLSQQTSGLITASTMTASTTATPAAEMIATAVTRTRRRPTSAGGVRREDEVVIEWVPLLPKLPELHSSRASAARHSTTSNSPEAIRNKRNESK